jgi:hypothetical protein
MALIKMPVPAQMQQVQLINQPMPLQQIDRPIHRYPRNIRIDLLRLLQNLARIQMSFRILNYLQQHTSLPRQTDPLRGQLPLQYSRRFRIDPFACADAMWWKVCCAQNEMPR